MNNISLLTFLTPFLKSIPKLPLQVSVSYALRQMERAHSAIFAKVLEQGEFTYLIKPTDLPFNFYFVIAKENPGIRIISKESPLTADATITASLQSLCEMLEGRLDGDAAFFSNNLIIEGSTLAVVTLRNAIEAEPVNIVTDLSKSFGFFSKYIESIFSKLLNKYREYNNNLHKLLEAILSESKLQSQIHSAQISQLREEINKIKGN